MCALNAKELVRGGHRVQVPACSSVCEVLLALAVWGCSSGGSHGGGSSGHDCTTGCQKIVAAGCPNDNQAKCETHCEHSLAQACLGSAGALYDCLLGFPLHCNPDGEAAADTTALTGQCLPQVLAAVRCEACVVDSNDGACGACRKASCCTEIKAIYEDPSFSEYYKCSEACQDGQCQASCRDQYPSLSERDSALASCASSKCASQCAK